MWRIFAQVLELQWLKVRRFARPLAKVHKSRTLRFCPKKRLRGIPWLVLLVFPTTWKVKRLCFSRKNFFPTSFNGRLLSDARFRNEGCQRCVGASCAKFWRFRETSWVGGDCGTRLRSYHMPLAHSFLLLPTKWRNFIIFGPKMQFLRKLVHFRIKWGLLL